MIFSKSLVNILLKGIYYLFLLPAPFVGAARRLLLRVFVMRIGDHSRLLPKDHTFKQEEDDEEVSKRTRHFSQ